MKIKWILNNNAVIVMEEDEEIVVKGKGIAFGKRAGDVLEQEKIERIFRMEEPNTQRRYQELLQSIPEDCIDVSEKIIDMIKQEIDRQISDTLYITLTDHISNLLERIRMGVIWDNSLLLDVRRLYPEEYAVGKRAVVMIEETFDIKIVDDEASFIALHIVSAEMDNNFDGVLKATKMINDVYDIIESDFDLDVDEESLVYTRFMIHLRVFFERILDGKAVTTENNLQFRDMLQKEYPKQYQTAEKIMDYVGKEYHQSFDGEILYLLVHIIKLTQ